MESQREERDASIALSLQSFPFESFYMMMGVDRYIPLVEYLLASFVAL